MASRETGDLFADLPAEGLINPAGPPQPPAPARFLGDDSGEPSLEIGRASCRERV